MLTTTPKAKYTSGFIIKYKYLAVRIHFAELHEKLTPFDYVVQYTQLLKVNRVTSGWATNSEPAGALSTNTLNTA